MKFSLRSTLKGHGGWVTCIVTSPESPNMIVSGSRDKSIMVWRITRDESDYGIPQKSLLGHNHTIQDLAISADGMFVLSASWDKTLRLWDLSKGETVRQFVGHDKDVVSVSFSPDHRQIATGSRDRTLKLWNTLGECKYSTEGHSEWVSCVRFSPNPDNPVIVTCGWDKLVKVWDMTKLEPRYQLIGHNGYVSKVAISPDGSLCASGGKDCKLMLWNLEEGKHLQSVELNSEVYDICFCPTQPWVAVAYGSFILVWDVITNSEVDGWRIELPASNISGKALPIQSLSLAWSADGATLYSGHSDSLIRVWAY